MLARFGITFSTVSIQQERKKLGWVATGPKYCQLICVANQEKRLVFAEKVLKENEQFNDIIFTDECSIQLDRHARLCFRKKNQPKKLKGKVKHPIKLHVWAGITKRGPTSIDLRWYNEGTILC